MSGEEPELLRRKTHNGPQLVDQLLRSTPFPKSDDANRIAHYSPDTRSLVLCYRCRADKKFVFPLERGGRRSGLNRFRVWRGSEQWSSGNPPGKPFPRERNHQQREPYLRQCGQLWSRRLDDIQPVVESGRKCTNEGARAVVLSNRAVPGAHVHVADGIGGQSKSFPCLGEDFHEVSRAVVLINGIVRVRGKQQISVGLKKEIAGFEMPPDPLATKVPKKAPVVRLYSSTRLLVLSARNRFPFGPNSRLSASPTPPSPGGRRKHVS